ncbi:hypothetical protein [Methylobacterium oryzisoli]|uniref:hypothetical protein n=1 Tax=Methylobacterium oryzisoli TaxID=3385502 RepID=UPI003891D2CE
MDDAQKLATTQACQDLLEKAAEVLRSDRRSGPVETVEQGLRLVLHAVLADLVSLYVCDPHSVGDDEDAHHLLNRVLTELSNLDEQGDATSLLLQ